MSKSRRWISKGKGWVNEDGATINLVNPRGKALYARRNPGSQRPQWFDTLAEARRGSPEKALFKPTY